MIKLTETQSLILSAGAYRPDNLALPLPKWLVGAAAKMAVGKMIGRGWLQEVDANQRGPEPHGAISDCQFWRSLHPPGASGQKAVRASFGCFDENRRSGQEHPCCPIRRHR